MIVYNSDYVLGECLRSVLPFGPVVVTEGPCGYWRDHQDELESDKTLSILEAHKNYGHGIIDIKRGEWAEKDEMSNALMDKVPDDTTHVFLVDSDEVWRLSDLVLIRYLIQERDFDSMAFTADSFFGGFERILSGFERDFPVVRVQRFYPGARWSTHRPPTILSKEGLPWKEYNHMSAKETLAWGITMPHYSYVFPSQARMKHTYYSHYSPGITIPNYIDEVFLPWASGTDEEREVIEDRWNGVHNFVPSYRKECRTMPFIGLHPEEIRINMPQLQKRLQSELSCQNKS